MSPSTGSHVQRLPLVIFAVMSILCFGGPFGVGWVLQGGQLKAWPPDRPVEWVALIGSCLLVALFMLVLLRLNLKNMREMNEIRKQFKSDQKREES
jgi:hypothetical protein